MIKKFQIIVLALFAVFALSAILVSTASAETTLEAKWLANGNNIPAGGLAAEASGEVLLEDTAALGAGHPASVLCSGIFDGLVGPGGEGLIEVELNLAKEEIVLLGLALLGTGPGSDCVTDPGSICLEGTAASPIEDWPEKLPWPTLIFLMENGKILSLVEGGATEMLCLIEVLGVAANAEDLCEAADAESEVLNDLEDVAIPSEEIGLPLGTCTKGGEASGVIESDSLSFITLVNGELLTVSSE